MKPPIIRTIGMRSQRFFGSLLLLGYTLTVIGLRYGFHHCTFYGFRLGQLQRCDHQALHPYQEQQEICKLRSRNPDRRDPAQTASDRSRRRFTNHGCRHEKSDAGGSRRENKKRIISLNNSRVEFVAGEKMPTIRLKDLFDYTCRQFL